MTSEATPASQRRVRWIVAGVVLAGVLIGLVAAFGFDRKEAPPSVLIGEPVPPLTLDYLEQNGALALDSVEGVAVVNFWATWCVACRDEHQLLLTAADAYRGVEFLGIVYQDETANAVEFLDERGRGYANLVDPASRAAVDFGVFGIPETYFLAEGQIVAKVSGPLTDEVLASTLNSILVGESPGGQTTGTIQGRPEG